MQNLIIVSNRLPFRIDKKGAGTEIKQSSGGLVSALESLSSESDSVTWVGIADFKKEVWNEIKHSVKTSKYKIEPVFADKKDYQLYYNGFSNTVIWPLFHYFPDYAEYKESFFEAYKRLNQKFAEKICEMAKAGDTIWIHDYHLMLLPKYIKERRPDLKIGFFLHIPFPSYEILKFIPASWRNEILEGLIYSDVLGFHTNEYLSHFKRSVAYFLGIQINNDRIQVNGHNCLTKAYPISIDFQRFNRACDYPAVVRGRNNIRQRNKDQKIIFSVDRLDYTKGVINRLQAYEQFLEMHHEYREKVVFVINVVPSRDQITKYAERKKMIEENIGRINGLYGNMKWQPVIYQYRHLTFNQLLSFYTVADIGLVTPLRDGMNLVAKEFVASRKDKRGTLILSESAGAAKELKEAILVNPNDVQTMMNGILNALTLSEKEQEEKMEKMQSVLRANDIQKWRSSFINDLKKSSVANIPRQPQLMSFDEKRTLLDSYSKTQKRLLLLDYDGTLVPHYNRPEEAVPTPGLKELLQELNSHPENEVIIISGRDAPTLEKWFSGTGISLVAEHGALFKKEGTSWVNFSDNPYDWKNEVEQLFETNVQMYAGSFVEKKEHSIAFHYRTVDQSKAEELKSVITKELLMLDTYSDFNIIHGNKVIEVKNTGIDKGSFTAKLIGENTYDFVLAMGDDTTDEDMFSALSDHDYYTIKVGITPTLAKCNLINVNNVISFLDQLNKYKSVRYLKAENI